MNLSTQVLTIIATSFTGSVIYIVIDYRFQSKYRRFYPEYYTRSLFNFGSVLGALVGAALIK
jgi:hypothetical protein